MDATSSGRRVMVATLPASAPYRAALLSLLWTPAAPSDSPLSTPFLEPSRALEPSRLRALRKMASRELMSNASGPP